MTRLQRWLAGIVAPGLSAAVVIGLALALNSNCSGPTRTSPVIPNPTGPALRHLLYVFRDGEMDVYDIDNDHAPYKRVGIPSSGVYGVMVSPPTGMLYLAEGTTGRIIKYNLVTDRVAWTTTYAFGVDSPAITPDGQTIYSPDTSLHQVFLPVGYVASISFQYVG